MRRHRPSVTVLLTAALLASGALAAAPAGARPHPGITPGGGPADAGCVAGSREGTLEIDLLDIPDPVYAGAWAEFTYRVTNTYDVPLDRVYTWVSVGAYDTTDGADIGTETQWYADGAWTGTEGGPGTDGYFGHTGRLGPGAWAQARMRVRVDAGAPGWTLGTAALMGTFARPDGVCETTVDDLEFDVEAAP